MKADSPYLVNQRVKLEELGTLDLHSGCGIVMRSLYGRWGLGSNGTENPVKRGLE